MKFTKMHGLGNDYIYVDGSAERISDPSALARRLSDRHRGVGGDGLIIIHPPSKPDFACRMEMYNADGSRAQMCGNGIRCVAKFVLDRGRAAGPGLIIETDAGPKTLRLVERGADGRAHRIEVNMGIPRWRRAEVPMRDGGPPAEPAVEVPLEVVSPLAVPSPSVPEGRFPGGTYQGRRLRVTGVSMGNPHCVVRIRGSEPFGAPLSELDLTAIGPPIERHSAFPERVNVEFVEPRGRRDLDFRVWERGSGETQACGTGACAAVVAGVLAGWCDREAVVHLRGGDLEVRWDESSGQVMMTGPAVEVFSGELTVNS